ncbi:MAG: hypothetical protein V3U14_13060 [candidate division NC10 bacterium]
MANELFRTFKERALDSSGANYSSADVRGVLIDAADDTVTDGVDDFLDDLAAGARIATSGALGTLSVTDGAYDSAAVTLSSVSGDQAEEWMLYQHTGVESTSLIIVNYDTFASGMPVTPNGGDIIITPNASGWFAF